MASPLAHLLADGHEELYRTNGSFYNAVNTLASMLPAMVAGIAEQSVEAEARFQESVRLMAMQTYSIPRHFMVGGSDG